VGRLPGGSSTKGESGPHRTVFASNREVRLADMDQVKDLTLKKVLLALVWH
jgi:hypothetical protein